MSVINSISALFKKITPKRPLYVQITFTIFSFLLMVVLSYLFTSNIVKKYLTQNTENILNTVQSQVISDLMEPQLALESFSRAVRNMILQGESSQRIKEYYNDISNYLTLNKQNYLSFNGFLGYFETLPEGHVFMESFAWDRPVDFNPEERAWYLNAVEANGRIAETLMYHDVIYSSADVMLIYTMCIYDTEGKRLGVVGLRVQIDTIKKYIINTMMANNEYGILLSKDMIILVHPSESFIGRNAHEPGIPFLNFVEEIENGVEIIERPLITYKGESAVATFRVLPNGWFLGIVTPKGPYYKNVITMAAILLILGVALSAVLIFVLIRVDAAREKSDLENIHKSSFLANMSHEIRTPMNAIIGMTDLLLYEQLNKRQTGFVNDIKTSAKSLLSIINDILDLSKIEAGKLELNPVNYDFHVFLDNIFSMFSYVTQKKKLAFYYEVEGQMPNYLYGDDVRLKQVLTNICGNAVKYTEKGYVKFKVSTADNKLKFEIKDSGIGIRKEDLSKLFNTFQRIETEKTHNTVGTGLGLSISKTFVEMMGGQIIVDSEYEQGTVFIVTIPIVEGNKEEAKLKKGLDDDGQVIIAPTAKVLVVDDNEFNLKVAEGLFNLFKINIQTAFSGKEAIELIKSNIYDIVFMDHMMPEMDGVEATAIIRKMEKYKDLPIIALTANAVQGAKEMFLSSGFNGFVSKPIDMHEMYKTLKEWLPAEKVEIKKEEILEKEHEVSEFIRSMGKINEINTDIGLERVSGMEDMYKDTVELFNKKLVAQCDTMTEKLNAKDANGFAILIHAMKSQLATIGAMTLSELALRMETAAKKDDLVLCDQHFPSFKDKLLILHDDLSVIFPDTTKKEVSKKKGDIASLKINIDKALEAAGDFDRDAGLNAISDLLNYDFGEQTNTDLENVTAAFKDFNFDSVSEILNKLKTTV